jgi:hypothetical protein
MEKTGTNRPLFCAACGERLRAWDFLNGRALFRGNQPYCDPCRRPVPEEVPLVRPFTGGARRLPTNWSLF